MSIEEDGHVKGRSPLGELATSVVILSQMDAHFTFVPIGESVTPSLVSSHAQVLETGEIDPKVVGVSMLAVDALRGEWG